MLPFEKFLKDLKITKKIPFSFDLELLI